MDGMDYVAFQMFYPFKFVITRYTTSQMVVICPSVGFRSNKVSIHRMPQRMILSLKNESIPKRMGLQHGGV